jgi:hypothetical protein
MDRANAMDRENKQRTTISGASAEFQPATDAEDDIQGRISFRAYELYQQRGGEPGHDLDDWLQAEQELLSAPNRNEAGRPSGQDQSGAPPEGGRRLPRRVSEQPNPAPTSQRSSGSRR